MKFNIREFIKSYPIIYKVLLPFYKKIIFSTRGGCVIMMMLLINLFPRQIYIFSKRKVLPSPDLRNKLKNLKFPPYEIIQDKTSHIEKMDEIYVIGTGFKNFNLLKKINKPIFLISFWDTLKIDDEGNIFYLPDYHPIYQANNPQSLENKKKKFTEYKNENITYVHGISVVLDKILKKGNKVLAIINHLKTIDGQVSPISRELSPKTPITINGKTFGVPLVKNYKSYENFLDDKNIKRIFITENINKPFNSSNFPFTFNGFVPTGSLITALSALFFYAKKINIYGWDFYLKSSPKFMNTFQLMKSIYNFKNDIQHSNYLFEAGILNLYFAYRFSLFSNIKNFGYLGELQNHKKLISKIEKVFFD